MQPYDYDALDKYGIDTATMRVHHMGASPRGTAGLSFACPLRRLLFLCFFPDVSSLTLASAFACRAGHHQGSSFSHR